ncbi:CRISPR-associated endoribonuclease Cas6 [Sulfobacillus thermosulfidooxidans]|uniref:CRISPR-associated endoribonuclease Cas6 n=1 Tax=Sulfobacillus thermosulfidooxidans TaxID=28034 RepID=UPI0006B68DEE|nr:CRISPR-associated endoribonuclease Cas6 [Sulfobacillus thermosulfidooxidans]
MRLWLKIVPQTQPFSLSTAYNHLLAAFFYQALPPDVQAFWHRTDHGVHRIHPFSFSRILTPFTTMTPHQLHFDQPLIIAISTADETLAQHWLHTFTTQPSRTLANQPILIDTVRVETYDAPTSTVLGLSLSPITTYYTPPGQSQKIYVGPHDPQFATLLYRNLTTKCQQLLHRDPLEPLHWHPLQLTHHVIHYKHAAISGWHGTFMLSGHPRDLTLLWQTGLGPLGSAGFGLWEARWHD